LADARAAAQAGGVVNPKLPLAPVEFDCNRIAGDSGFRPGQQPFLAQQAVDQRGLTGIWPADNGDPNRMVRLRALPFLVLLFGGGMRQSLAQRLVEVRQTFAMLGTDRNRITEAKRIGLERTSLASAALAFIGDENRTLARLANHVREHSINRGRAGSR